jgi:hypothetical protein
MKISEIFRKKQASVFSNEVDPFTTLNTRVNRGTLIGKGFERKTRSTEDNDGVFRTSVEMHPFDRTLKPISLASPSECNCSQILGIQEKSPKGFNVGKNDTAEDVKNRFENVKKLHDKTYSPDIVRDSDAYRDGWSPDNDNIETTKQFHKEVVDKWLNLMREPDDAKRFDNVNTLSRLTRKQPLADSGDEFNNHFLMHLYNAGNAIDRIVTPVEQGGLGVQSFGKNFVQSQGVAQRAEVASRTMPNYNKDNCGVCEQYKNMYQNNIIKYKQENENSKKSGESGKALFPDDENKSAMEIYRDVYHEFMSGQRRKTAENPTIASAYDTLDKFNQHQKEAHNVTFSNMYDKYTPVEDDETTRRYAKNLFNNIRGLGNGWSLRPRGDSPRQKPNVFSDPDSRTRPGWWGPEISGVERSVVKNKRYPTTTGLTGKGLNVKMVTEADGKILSLIKPEGTPTGEGSYFTKTPTYERTIGLQEYNPSADPRRKLFDKPLEEVEHPEIKREDLRKLDIPRFHKYVFQKSGFFPRMKSQEDYKSSLGRACLDLKMKFEKERKKTRTDAIPYSLEQFTNLLTNDHNKLINEAEKRIKRSRTPGMVGPTASKKRDNEMPTFNSRNNKEAHVDPSLLQHGFDTVVKGIQSGGDFVIQKGQQFVHDVLHPFSHHFDGNQEKLDQLRQTLKFDNAGYGETSDMAWRANDALGDYINNHQHLDPNWVGIGTDVGVPAAFTTYVKRKEITDAVKNKVDSLKGKLKHRTDSKSELDRRKNIWDSAPDHACDELVEDYGRQVNPYHPNHMDFHAPGSDGPWDRIAGVGVVPRTSSKINNLSARLFSN